MTTTNQVCPAGARKSKVSSRTVISTLSGDSLLRQDGEVWVSRLAHNQKFGGSNPSPAPNFTEATRRQIKELRRQAGERCRRTSTNFHTGRSGVEQWEWPGASIRFAGQHKLPAPEGHRTGRFTFTTSGVAASKVTRDDNRLAQRSGSLQLDAVVARLKIVPGLVVILL